MKFIEYVKLELKAKLNHELAGLPFIEKLYENIDNRIDRLNNDLGQLKHEMNKVIAYNDIIKASFHPVVLFKGRIKLSGTDIKELYDYAFAVKPNNDYPSANGDIIIHFQPDTEITFTSLELLNGPYDIVEVVIANCHLIPTHFGIIPPGVETALPAMVGKISPANRVYIRIRKRD